MLQKILCLRQPVRERFDTFQVNLTTDYNDMIPQIFAVSYNKSTQILQQLLSDQQIKDLNEEFQIMNKAFNSVVNRQVVLSQEPLTSSQVDTKALRQQAQLNDMQIQAEIELGKLKAQLQEQAELQELYKQKLLKTEAANNEIRQKYKNLVSEFNELVRQQVKEEVAQVDESKQELINKNAALMVQIESAREGLEENKDLRQKYADLQAQFNEDSQTHRQQIMVSEQLVQKLQAKISAQQIEIENLNTSIKTLNQQLNQQNIKNDEILAEINEQEDWKRKFEVMKIKCEQVQISERQNAQQAEILNNQLIKKQEELDGLQQLVRQQEQDIEESHKLNKQYNKLQQDYSTLRQNYEKCSENGKALAQQMQLTQQSVESIRSSLQISQKQLLKANQDKEKLKQQLGEQMDQNDSGKKTIARNAEQIETLQKELQASTQSREQLAAQVQRAEQELQRMEKQYNAAHSRLRQLEQDGLVVDNQRIANELARVKQRLQQRNKTIDDLIRHINIQQVQKDSMQAILYAKILLADQR